MADIDAAIPPNGSTTVAIPRDRQTHCRLGQQTHVATAKPRETTG